MFDVVIAGAGLSGLVATHECQAAGLSVCLLDASSRYGGRIHSVFGKHSTSERERGTDAVADLGPTWVWPEFQPEVSRWLDRLGVEILPQFDDGLALVERQFGTSPEQHQVPGQHGIKRLRGGPQALINALYESLQPGTFRSDFKVSRLSFDQAEQSVRVTGSVDGEAVNKTNTEGGRDTELLARQVVICMPLRIVQETLSFFPELPADLLQTIKETPTWMAAQAKVVAMYPHAFWRDRGLSGRVVSQLGPLVEIHDHCGAEGSPAALFGFVGVPATARVGKSEQLRRAIEEQLVRCFGEEGKPGALHIEDWANNPLICASADLSGPAQHPGVAAQNIRRAYYDGHLRFAVAETAIGSPGLIDGAFEAGSRAAAEIVEQLC